MTGAAERTGAGPVPARPGGRTDHGGGEPPGTPDLEHHFQAEGREWVARRTGMGCYGTGRKGTARLVAVHFFTADAPERPVREALMPAGAFSELQEKELLEVWSRATPIETER